MPKQGIEQIWEIHKPLLWSIWVRDKKSMNTLQEEMQTRGFYATSIQKHFKDWGFQQKVSAENWKVIGHCVGKRKREGLDSVVIIDGARIPKIKVLKETSRHFFQTKELMGNPTPSYPGTAIISISSPMSFSLLDAKLAWPDSMPWITFSNTYFQNTSFIMSKQENSATSSSSVVSQAVSTAALISHNSLQHSDVLEKASRMAVRMPECFAGQHLLDSQMLALGRPCDAELVKLKLALYQMANNIEISGNILELFDISTIQAIIPITQVASPLEGTIGAILERIFQEAVLGLQYDVLRWLLELGISPQRRIADEDEINRCHLPLVLLINNFEASHSLGIINLLLENEKPNPGGFITKRCCETHGSLLEHALREAEMPVLDALLDREVELHGSKFLCALDAHELLCQVVDDLHGLADQKIRRIFEFYFRPYASALGLWGDLLSTNGLIEAVEDGSSALLKFLHQSGANFNCHDECARFPLGASAQKLHNEEQLELLLSLGAQVNYTPQSTYGKNSFSALHFAMLGGNPTACRTLLRHGANPNTFGSHHIYSPTESITPLQFCFSARGLISDRRFLYFDLDLPYLLLDYGALLIGDELLRLALHFSTVKVKYRGLLPFIMRLVSEGLDLNVKTAAGDTAMDISIREGTTELTLALIRAGSEPSDRANVDYTWFTGLQAIQDMDGSPASIDYCVAYLQQAGCLDPQLANELWFRFFKRTRSNCLYFAEEYATSTLHSAVGHLPEDCHIHALWGFGRTMASDFAKTRLSGFSLLQTMLEVVQPLEYPTPSDARNDQILELIADIAFNCEDDFRIFDALISKLLPMHGNGHNYLSPDEDPLHMLYSANSQDYETRKVRVREHLVAKFFASGFQPTTAAGLLCVAKGSIKEIQMFIAHGFNPSRRYPWFSTALQVASFRGDLEIITLLLKSGVQINSLPAWSSKHIDIQEAYKLPLRSHTALQAAVSKGDPELMKLLLDAGADVNAKPALVAGATALQLAAINGDVGIVRWLIAEYGANVNAPGAQTLGRTALEGAAEHGRLDMVHLLLQSGCQITGDGRAQFVRAVVRANRNQHHALVSILKNYGRWSRVDEEDFKLHEEAIETEQQVEEDMCEADYFGPEWDQSDDGECCDDSACDCCPGN